MQKLNLNNIPEAPENKDFWVVGTANREGSIDSNSYKKNLAKIGGSLEDMTASLTTEQKMQARKNLGLYYEDTQQGEKTAKYTDEPFTLGYAKISEDTPSKEDIVKIVNTAVSQGEIPAESLIIRDVENGYDIFRNQLEGGFQVRLTGEDKGIYITQPSYDIYRSELVYNGPVEIAHKIDEKYLPEIDEKELIRHTISTMNPLRRIIFWEDLVYLVGATRGTRRIITYGVKDSADLESLSKMPVEEDVEEAGEDTLTMRKSQVLVEFKTLKQLIDTENVTPTYTILSNTLQCDFVQGSDNTITKGWQSSNFISTDDFEQTDMNLFEVTDDVREGAPISIPDDVHYILQVELITTEGGLS